MIKRAVVLIGSPKGPESASVGIADYLTKFLAKAGVVSNKIYICNIIKSQADVLRSIAQADLIIISSPLYVDSAPYIVTKFMETCRNQQIINKWQRLFIITNCGYPESSHNEVALSIYRRFAKELELKWLGSISIGMGLAFQDRGMQKLSLLFSKFRHAMENIANALAREEEVPKKWVDMLATPFIPIWLYNFLLGIEIIIYCTKNRVLNINYKPFRMS